MTLPRGRALQRTAGAACLVFAFQYMLEKETLNCCEGRMTAEPTINARAIAGSLTALVGTTRLVGTTLAVISMIIALLATAASASAATTGNGRGAQTELIMIEEAGCHWCERWDEEIGVVYHKTDEAQIAPLRRVDMHGSLPSDLTYLRKGSFTPTFVLVSQGREVGRIRGYPGEDFFWPMLHKLMEKLPTSANGSDTRASAE